MASAGVCHEFARLGRCSKSVCRFQHTRNAQSSMQDTQNRQNRPNQTRVLSEADGELQAWKNSFVLKSSFMSDHDGKLGKFFKKARQLIEMDAGSKQDVIRTLSQEHGLIVIRSLLEQSFELNDDDLIFNSQIMPFLEIITHPTVLGSMILQQFVGTIYGYMFGVEGARAARVLGKICNLLEKTTAKETSIQRLEVSLLFFSRILDLNSTAIIQESLHQLARRFEWVFNSMVKVHGPTQLAHCRDYLTRLQRRLAVGASLPTASTQNRSEPNDDAFVFLREGPGGRHGNDHGDICDIAIMPTFEEIASARSEYLPVNSSAEWHLEGIDGLLDRNFRLLREDTVGQLRDAVHHLLDDTQSIRPRVQLRKHEYKHAEIADCHANWLTGLEFEVKIPQPAILTDKSTIAREEWWVASRRLQPGALVCLSIHQLASILFCTVAEQKSPRAEPNGETKKPRRNLWRRAATASITLVLVDPRDTNVKTVLDLYDRTGMALSLVEFPGILLPSFEPTLKALQTIKKNPVMPFLDLLMPSTPGMPSSIHLAPPLYSLKPEFAFNLASLMKNQADFLVYPNKKVDLQKLHGNSTLDEAQAEALIHCLQHNIGLIQGPPGTGKSYTGAALIKVLLESKKSVALGPIVCVTFTNHALDQLLEDVLDQGITSKVIRIGGQSKSERLDAFNLNVVARNLERTKMEKGSFFQERQIMQKSEVEFNNINLRKQVPAADLVSFLRVFYPHHHKQLFGEDGCDFQPVVSGNSNIIIRKWVNSGLQLKHDPESIEKLLVANLFDLSHQERWMLHNLWTKEILEHAQKGAIEAITSHSVAKSRYTAIQDELHLRCLHQADVIGMTTAGLARRLKMLQNLQCKVVLCEEAGEVLEPHLLTAFLPEVEHVILIGDHQQLPPRVQNYDLSRENRDNGAQYSLDVSLFERLLDSKKTALGCELPFKALETQRRMHPSIAELIRGPSYPHLKDHPLVSGWPEVTGMRRRLFWLDHRVSEGGLSNAEDLSTSHWNDFEVDMTMALVNHLIRQGGYQEGDIAVITPYLGQLHRFRQKLQDSVILALNENDQEDLKNAGFEFDPQGNKPVMKAPLSRVLRVSTVDNFQGEEAKVVVVSLVRSNQNSSCGFLRTPNRINVLLSRAQHGMYIIGNSTTSKHVKMWARVIDILRRNNNIGGALELQCPRHPNTIVKVTKPDDFARLSPEGGCDLPCANRLSCGHPCIQKCHSDVLHSAVKCLEPCPRSRKGCDHQCPNVCGDRCPEDCKVVIIQKGLKLSCGHAIETLECWEDQNKSTYLCPKQVEKTVPGCSHKVTVECHVEVNDSEFRCRAPCRCELPCGHLCARRCSVCAKEFDSETLKMKHGKCQQVCGRKQTTCSHSCLSTCHGNEQCPPCNSKCEVACGHSQCPKKCFEPCTPCAQNICLSACPHSQCSMPCAAPCDHIPCSLRCEKILKCGHRCPSVCGEKCPTSVYCQVCATYNTKNQNVDYLEGATYKNINLDENPCIFPTCGHFLTMESMDAQMDLKRHYQVNKDGKPTAILASSQPFSMEDIKTCGICRGPLRNIARYGRLVRRALLDESTKKLILRLNQEFIPLAQKLAQEIQKLQGTHIPELGRLPEVEISGRSSGQIKVMKMIMDSAKPQRWENMIKLREQIMKYLRDVNPEEQPFQRVREMVVNAQRHKTTSGDFTFGDEILQTKGVLQAAALSLRLDIALLADFLDLERLTKYKEASLKIDLRVLRNDCDILVRQAQASHRPVHETEGWIFKAQLYALERGYVSEELGTDHLQNGRLCIYAAKKLCQEYSGQTRGLGIEVDNAQQMLNGGSFYAEVTSQERMEVISVMARGFEGTGHWYYCRNNHPFTIGECGGAMETASCPECGAPVGGEDHFLAPGVTRAEEYERNLEQDVERGIEEYFDDMEI